MSVVAILIIGAGVIWALVMPMLVKRSASKRFVNVPDRRVINAKLTAAHVCRALIAVEILVALSFAFFLTYGVIPDTDIVFAVFLFALLAIMAGRSGVRHVQIAAETEMEYRRLHAERPSE